MEGTFRSTQVGGVAEQVAGPQDAKNDASVANAPGKLDLPRLDHGDEVDGLSLREQPGHSRHPDHCDGLGEPFDILLGEG
jgi:hypothetical protein